MFYNDSGYLTSKEMTLIDEWLYREYNNEKLPTTYDNTQPDVAVNMIKTMSYYKEHENVQ